MRTNLESPRATLTIAETANYIGLSLGSTKAAINRGEIPSVRIGRRVLVPREALNRLFSIGSQ
jgi:excisionase family DNA binding protein